MRNLDLDAVLIVDLESTCWETNPPPDGQVSDIIEIGVTPILLRDLTVGSSESIIVKPTRSTISAFCTHLTTLTQKDVAKGVDLKTACETLQRKYKSNKRTWASFGDYDRRMMEASCKELGVTYPFSIRHINIKNLIAVGRGWPKELGMAQVLGTLDMHLEGTHHRGGDDSRNIAKIFVRVLKAIRQGA